MAKEALTSLEIVEERVIAYFVLRYPNAIYRSSKRFRVASDLALYGSDIPLRNIPQESHGQCKAKASAFG